MKEEDLALMSKFIKDSECFPKWVRALNLGLWLGLFVICWSLSYSQISPATPYIKKISVEVKGQAETENMKELIPLKEGDQLSLYRITNSIKELYKTGLFSDVQVVKEGQSQVNLTYRLTKKLFVRKILFLGQMKISSKKLKEEIYSLREQASFSEGKLKLAADELKRALSKEGYFSPEIKISTKKDFKTSIVDVYFEISSAQRYLVKKVNLEGRLIVSSSQLKAKMETKENQTYIPSLLERDVSLLREFYSSLGYHRVEVEVGSVDFKDRGEVYITIKINPQEKVEIVVEGAEVPLSLIQPIWEERIFEEWGLAEGEAKIINYLRGKGYLFSSVKSSLEKGKDKIRVVYQVVPGKKFGIKDIIFKGLKYFTSSQLKEQLGIREKIPFLKWISGSRVFSLPKEIESLYQREGFPHTSVDLNFIREDSKVKVVYYIEEGSQERIEQIRFKGTNLFPPELLLKQISATVGGPFFRASIQKDAESLERFYLDQGVRGTRIEAKIEEKSPGHYLVYFDINEGHKVKIDKIIISGNRVTRKGTILRELKIREGDFARYGAIQETKRSLERLGIFTEVKIDEVTFSEDAENLIISLREGDRNYLGLGVGLETKNEPRTFAVWNNVIRPRGTTEFIRSNILGRAAQLSLVGQISLREKRGVISWEEPYFFGLPWQTYLNAWLEREERISYSYDRRGISLTTIKYFSKNKMFLTTLRWARTTLFNLKISESEIDRQHSPFSASSISGSFIWDRRDDPFNPQRGSFFSFVLEWAYPLFGAKSDYLKNFIKYQNFISVFPDVTFISTFRLGLGRGNIPIHERFFAGGSNSFRGQEFDELGPKDPHSLKPIGGKALVLLNFELTFPLFPSIRDLFATFFYDKGNVFAKRKEVSLSSLCDALGIGLRYRTPLGPVRFELGWNLDAAKGDKKVLAFITIGNVF